MWYIIKILHWRFGYLKQKKLYAKSVGFSEIAGEFCWNPHRQHGGCQEYPLRSCSRVYGERFGLEWNDASG